ncbi:MAG: glycerophosphodiester phosphodiesterase family protein [Pseudomonadota bacterium]
MTRTPVAHRGLHDAAVPENTLAAVEAAIEAGFGVEVDLQLTADGGLAVIHDQTLDRTAHGTGPVMAHALDALRATPLKGIDETVSSLDDLLGLTSGRAPLFIEMKSPGSEPGRAAMAAAITKSLSRYGGAAAVMTFDVDLLALLRRALPDTPLGAVAGGEERGASLVSRFGRDTMLHSPRTKPDFIAYFATALPHPAVTYHRRKRPVLAWTVRSKPEASRLARHVDQIIFEGFRP